MQPRNYYVPSVETVSKRVINIIKPLDYSTADLLSLRSDRAKPHLGSNPNMEVGETLTFVTQSQTRFLNAVKILLEHSILMRSGKCSHTKRLY